jgi:oligosaccharyltransferase complex subunit alpha (ribophorin I)
MLRSSIGGLIFVILVTECKAATFDSVNLDLVIKNVGRSVDLSSQLVKISHKITLQNNGKGAVKSFLYTVEPEVKESLAYIGAQASTADKCNTGSVHVLGAAFAGDAGQFMPRINEYLMRWRSLH